MGMGANQTVAVRAPGPPILRIALVFYAGLLGAAFLWARLAGRALGWAGPQAAERGIELWPDVGWGVLVGLAMILASGAWTRATRAGDRLARALAAAVGRCSAVECALLALASGVAEEAFFRGAMQPQLGLVATSLLFGLAHFAPRRELVPWTAFSLAAGFALGGLFEATGNLLAPVVAHAVVNAINLRLLSRDYAES